MKWVKDTLFVFKSSWISKADIEEIKTVLIKEGYNSPLVFGGAACEGLNIYELAQTNSAS